MIGPGNNPNHTFRLNNPGGHPNGPRQLGQLFGENVETIRIGHDDDATGNAGLHITQVFASPSSHANNFFLNQPGQYNISWGTNVPAGLPQAQLGQLTRNVPTSAVSAVPPYSGPSTFPGAGAAVFPSQNQGRTTPVGNRGKGPTESSPTARPAFTRVSMPGTPPATLTD